MPTPTNIYNPPALMDVQDPDPLANSLVLDFLVRNSFNDIASEFKKMSGTDIKILHSGLKLEDLVNNLFVKSIVYDFLRRETHSQIAFRFKHLFGPFRDLDGLTLEKLFEMYKKNFNVIVSKEPTSMLDMETQVSSCVKTSSIVLKMETQATNPVPSTSKTLIKSNKKMNSPLEDVKEGPVLEEILTDEEKNNIHKMHLWAKEHHLTRNQHNINTDLLDASEIHEYHNYVQNFQPQPYEELELYEPDYTAPVRFISVGFQKSAKQEAEELASQSENRKPGESQPISLAKGFGDWEKHTRGIGAKLLLKMGYEAGKGLGKELQGRSTIVEAHLRKGKGAIGAYGKEGNRPKAEQQPIDSEEEEEQVYQEKLHQWKKVGKGQPKTKYIYKTADQILEDGKWRSDITSSVHPGPDPAASKVKIIDMTGKEQRVLSSYHAISAQKMRPEDEDSLDKDSDVKKINFDLPELRHNIELLLDKCEEDLISTDRALKHHQSRVTILQNEESKISDLIEREQKELHTLSSLLKEVEMLENQHEEGTLDLITARDLIEDMEQKYPEEYRGLELPYVAMTIVVPLLKSHLRSWDCLEKPYLNLDEFLKWQNLLRLSDYNGPIQPDPMDPFHTLLWECLMPMVRQSIMQWNPKDPDSMMKFLDIWSNIMPIWMKININDHILLPKLQVSIYIIFNFFF